MLLHPVKVDSRGTKLRPDRAKDAEIALRSPSPRFNVAKSGMATPSSHSVWEVRLPGELDGARLRWRLGTAAVLGGACDVMAWEKRTGLTTLSRQYAPLSA